METITSTDGTTIAWWKSGSGPPLLLVHGTTADHNRWSGIAPRFKEHFTVYSMDRRGRGGSTDASAYDLMCEARDVSAVVDTIAEPVSVLGHSYGGVCSLEASLITDGISKLVLYEPPIPTGVPMYPPGLPDRMQTLIDDDNPEAALEVFFREVVRMPDHEFREYRRLPMWKRRVELAATIPRELAIDRTYGFDDDKFAGLRVPALLLLGGDSPPLFQRAVERANAALPNASVSILPGQQHVAMDTNPDLFVAEVLGYLLG
jgi:pimeloyl-ACP methyl ester carboxylesterase